MKFIAHRGNINGPQPTKENTIPYISAALEAGFDVEIDVTYQDGKFFLGHDRPEHFAERHFFSNKRVWSHAKTVETFLELSKYKDVNVFFHTNEDIVVTSQKYIWNHSKTNLYSTKSVAVKLGYEAGWLGQIPNLHGVCSDYASSYKTEYDKSNALKKTAGCPFKLLVIDIDGVMTDGRKVYGLQGEVLSKQYCDIDFTAIKRFKAAGVKVCFLSGDTAVNQAMANIRKVDFYYARLPSGNIDKAEFVSMLSEKYGVTSSEMAYVGDDYYDLSIIENLPYTYCPSTAIDCIKSTVTKVLPVAGGHGVISALYDMHRDSIDFAFPVDSAEVNNI